MEKVGGKAQNQRARPVQRRTGRSKGREPGGEKERNKGVQKGTAARYTTSLPGEISSTHLNDSD